MTLDGERGSPLSADRVGGKSAPRGSSSVLTSDVKSRAKTQGAVDMERLLVCGDDQCLANSSLLPDNVLVSPFVCQDGRSSGR